MFLVNLPYQGWSPRLFITVETMLDAKLVFSGKRKKRWKKKEKRRIDVELGRKRSSNTWAHQYFLPLWRAFNNSVFQLPSFLFLFFFFSRKNQLVVPNCFRDFFKLFLPNVIYEFFNACFISNPRHFFSHSFVNFEEPVEPSKKKSFFLIARWKLYFFFYKRAICFRIIFIISIVWLSTRLVDDTINIKFCKITILIQK